MSIWSRLALIVGVGLSVQVANAQVTFLLQSATYSLDASGPFNFQYLPDNANGKVDFLPSSPAFKVGDSTLYGSGTATIIYTVTSNAPISGLDLVLQGQVQVFGEVNFTETAEAGTTNLGSVSGVVQGSSYVGGADGAFTRLLHLTFSQPVTAFKIKKTFDIDIGANRPPSTSIATVSVVEQNLTPVPEPASMACLALGALALIRKRRKVQ